MRIRFDLDFDGDAWPGPLHERQAVAGERWVGPQGLLSTIEIALGLTGDHAPPALRVAALARAVSNVEGFWSGSAEVDAMATAAVLLQWRDTLRLAGWSGAPVGAARVDQLAAVTRDVPPGQPDRLDAVIRCLQARSADIDRVETLTPIDELPWLWRTALAQLEARGTRVDVVAPAAVAMAPPDSDLARCRQRVFQPRRDGSLQLLRPPGPLAAADEVAAWLAAQPTLEGVVVIGADAVLDGALARHGLPVTGATRPVGLLGLLPLVLRAAVTPPDPAVMRELLLLPCTPFDADLTQRLVDALLAWPAVGSEDWNAALATADPDTGFLLTPCQRADEYDIEHAHECARLVHRYFDERRDDGAEWSCAAEHGSRVLQMMAPLRADPTLPPPRLSLILALVDEAARGVDATTPWPAQAGLRAVDAPGAVVGAAPVVVWWGFTSDRVAALPRLPFLRSEVGALEAAGVRLLDAGTLCRLRAERWRRPFMHAGEALMLVCPRVGENGGDLFPHPQWDVVVAAAGDATACVSLESASPFRHPVAPRVRPALEPLPTPRHALRAPPDQIALREVESPSSVGSLVGCSLRWALSYAARLRGGRSAPLSAHEVLLGRLAHALFAWLFKKQVPPPDREIEGRVRAWLGDEGPRRVGALFLPGQERLRDHETLRMIDAARDFATLLRDAGAIVEAVEADLPITDGPLRLTGRTDMLVRVGDVRTVVDLKWSGDSFHRDELASGTAYQLAAYARLADAAGVAYYVITSRRLLASREASLTSGAPVDGPSVAAMYSALENAVLARAGEIRAGDVRACGVPTDQGEPPLAKSRIEGGRLQLTAPCGRCDFSGLCAQEATHA